MIIITFDLKITRNTIHYTFIGYVLQNLIQIMILFFIALVVYRLIFTNSVHFGGARMLIKSN